MSWKAQPNLNDVRTAAKNNGYNVHGYYTKPDVWKVDSSESSGNPTVDPSEFGTRISAGSQKGGKLAISTTQGYQVGNCDWFRTTWLFDTRKNASPPKDKFHIGYSMDPDISSKGGAYLDVTNSEMVIAGKTKKLSFTIDNFQTVGVCIVYDGNKNESAIEVRTNNKSDVLRNSGTNMNNSIYGVLMESNGNGDVPVLMTNSLTLGYDWSI